MGRKSRLTIQKEAIEGQLTTFTSFFSAEDLYEKVKKKNSNIGIATVYRFLKSKRNIGALHQYTCEKKTLYSRSKLSHSHFTCEKCKKRTHFDLSSIDFVQKKIPGQACHIQLDVYGICSDCIKKL
jgi:Fur family transcriptional regulator, ferric uptake regulator